MHISLLIELAACGLPRRRQDHKTTRAVQQLDYKQLEMIPGFDTQGIHRIHCVVRPRPHLMTGTYPTSVKHRAYTPRA